MYYQALKRHGGNLCNITAWSKPIWKAIHCMISKVPALSQKWQNYGDNLKKKICPGLWEERYK